MPPFTACHRLTLSVLLLTICSSADAAAIFTPNGQPTGFVARPAVTNHNLASNNETVFRTDYEVSQWSGNLLAIPVDSAGNLNEAAERWTGGAAAHVDAQNYDTGRYIVTLKSDGSKIPFRWVSLSSSQQASIGDATNGPKLVNYVRGDRSNEKPSGANFRSRKSAMGDIVHSTPVYFDHGSYQMVYAGGNDGMLHAINAANGNEKFAFIPALVISNLNKLAADPYAHQYFVDGQIAVARVNVVGSTLTLLAGGLGAGGKGLYALDVTNPVPTSESDAASKILWEITSGTAGFGNLGYTYGTPRFARLNNGDAAIIVGNGYVNSGNGHAELFVINAATGAKIAEIDTGAGSVASPAGLSTPTLIDADNNGTADYAYAGDIDGNLWKFDLTAFAATKLFTTSPAQAITGAPVVYPHPRGGYIVDFATGSMLTGADAADTSVYYAYGIWDGAPMANTTLVSQAMTETAYIWNGSSVRVRTATNNVPNWASGGHRGWKTALPVNGERVLGDGVFWDSSRFYFTSTNPTITHASPPNGEDWLNELNYLTGGSMAVPFLDLNHDLALNDQDRIVDASGNPILTEAGVPVAKYIGDGLASQPILVDLSVLSTTLFTFNSEIVVASSAADRGVAGGHFDADIYYGTCPKVSKGKTDWKCTSNTHIHEYDDVYNVTGVNMLNASNPALNLVNPIASTTTSFKVLMANQKLSPAVTFSVGGMPHTRVTGYGTNSGLTVAALPTYTRAGIHTLEINMPLDAFQPKDWAGTGDVRVGLQPTQTDCVHKNDLGPSGEWRNGALTIQVISTAATDADIQLNVAGHPEMGYRLKDTSLGKLLAEYTYFWHHPNGMCYQNSGWTQIPPLDTRPSDPSKWKTPAAGSDDPKNGSFRATSAVVSVITTTSGADTTTVTTYADGTTLTVVKHLNADGSTTVTTTYPDHTVEVKVIPKAGSETVTGGQQSTSGSSRASWREITN